MPTYQVQQTWRAKRPKTVVSHDLEIPPQPPKNEFAEGYNTIYNIYLPYTTFTDRKKKMKKIDDRK